MVDTPIGSNSPNYTLVTGDVGATIFCRVTATNASGSAQAFSNVVGPVAAAGVSPPVNSVAPSIGPATTTQGTTYSVTSHGTWSGSPTFTRQWKRGATNVGDGSTSYTSVAGDVGSSITCVVTATNAGGSANATSNSVGPVTAAAAYTGPGQVVTGALAYWGLRGYNSSYTGPAIDIRNDADTATTTLNILSGGALDVASVPGTGGPFRVSKVYDQVGTNHLLQTVHANRPILTLNAVGARPGMRHGGTKGFDKPGDFVQAQPLTISSFLKIIDTAYSFLFVHTPGSSPQIRIDNGQPSGGPANSWIYAGSPIVRNNLAVNAWYGFQAVFNGATSDFNVNGAASVGDAGADGLTVTADLNVGYNAGGASFDGYLVEMGIWPSAFSGANSSAMYANQAAWWA